MITLQFILFFILIASCFLRISKFSAFLLPPKSFFTFGSGYLATLATARSSTILYTCFVHDSCSPFWMMNFTMSKNCFKRLKDNYHLRFLAAQTQNEVSTTVSTFSLVLAGASVCAGQQCSQCAFSYTYTYQTKLPNTKRTID